MGLAYLGKRGSKEILPSFPRNVGKPLDALSLPFISIYTIYTIRAFLFGERDELPRFPSIEGGSEEKQRYVDKFRRRCGITSADLDVARFVFRDPLQRDMPVAIWHQYADVSLESDTGVFYTRIEYQIINELPRRCMRNLTKI